MSIAIHNPLEQNFTCQSSGNCCRRPWKVKVASDVAEGIRTTDTFAQLKRRGFMPLPVVDGEIRVGREEKGACLFHRDDLCAIHGEKGALSKPVVCRLFPFSLVNTPEGYYLSLSFSCPSVVGEIGAPVSEQLAEIEEAIGGSTYYAKEAMSAESHVALTAGTPVSWGQYKLLEKSLFESFDGSAPIKSLLKLTSSLAGYVQSGCRGPWDPEHIPPRVVQAAAERFPLFLAYTIGVLETAATGEDPESYMGRLLEGEPVDSQLLGKPLPELEMLGPADREMEALTERYFANQLLGKQLISSGSLLSRLLTLSVVFAVLYFYLREKPDPPWAFALVESCVMSHSEKLQPIFEQYEAVLTS